MSYTHTSIVVPEGYMGVELKGRNQKSRADFLVGHYDVEKYFCEYGPGQAYTVWFPTYEQGVADWLIYGTRCQPIRDAYKKRNTPAWKNKKLEKGVCMYYDAAGKGFNL